MSKTILTSLDTGVNFVDGDQWKWNKEYGYPQTKFYKNHNTECYQIFGDAPQWIIDVAEKHFTFFSLSLIKQMPGNFLPAHKDKYFKFKQKYQNINQRNIIRYCIFLQDWKSGHYLEYNNIPITGWKVGDYLLLEQDVIHHSVNSGTEPKYTAQITGVLR